MKQYKNLMKAGPVEPAEPLAKEVTPGNAVHTTEIIPLITSGPEDHKFTVAIQGRPVDEAHLIHNNNLADPFAILKFKRYDTGKPEDGDFHSIIKLDNVDPNTKSSAFEDTIKDYIEKQPQIHQDRIYGNNQQTKRVLSFPFETK